MGRFLNIKNKPEYGLDRSPISQEVMGIIEFNLNKHLTIGGWRNGEK